MCFYKNFSAYMELKVNIIHFVTHVVIFSLKPRSWPRICMPNYKIKEIFTHPNWYLNTQQRGCNISVLCDADLKKMLKALKAGKKTQKPKSPPDFYIHTIRIIYIFSVIFNRYFGLYSKKLN